MRPTAMLVGLLALAPLAALPGAATAQDNPIVGSWITVQWDGADGDPQPGLLIFTETNYSMMFVPPGEERWTDEEIVAAVRTLIANSGRYTRDGDQITTEAYVALNPNYMFEWGENHTTYTFRVEGDRLHLTWPEDFGASGGLSGTFRRVGN